MNQRLLLVEDDPTNLKLLTYMLKPCGYQIFTAISGNEALKIAEDRQPDVILLDIRLPDINGFEICKILKSREETKHIPIIFVSALAHKEFREKGLELGAADFIVKPFLREDIILSIEIQLKLKELASV